MRCTELLPLFPKYGLSGDNEQVCDSAHCKNLFRLKDGWAFMGCGSVEGEVRYFFFCCAKCVLEAFPPNSCAGRA